MSSWLDSLITVQSVFGRTSQVVAESGDYAATQITDDSVSGPGTTVAVAIDELYGDLNTLEGSDVDDDSDSGPGTTVSAAIDDLYARDPEAATYANPQVFTRADQFVVETGESGTLTLQPAGSGHDDTAIASITIYIKASSSVTALGLHANYGQDGTPLADFDAAKGYLVFITRFVNGADVAYAVTGKVIAS